MPTVPVYNRQVQESGTPNIRVNPSAPIDSFGGGQGLNKIQQASDEVFSIVQNERKKADQLAVLEADAATANLKNKLFYDPKEGAMNKRGKDAFGAVDEYNIKFDEETKKIEEGLNGNQKAAFRQRLIEHKGDLNNQLQKHVFAESQEFDKQTSEARISVARDEAVLNYQDPFAVGKAIEVQKQTIAEHAQRMGLPEDWAKSKIQDTVSKTHSAIIDRMLANDQDVFAEEYFKTNKDQFSADDIARVESHIEIGSVKGKSQRIVDDMMGKHSSMTSAIEEARKIDEPKVRDAVVSRIKDEFALKRVAKEEAQKNLFDSAANLIESSKGNKDAIPAGIWAGLSLQDRNAIDNRARQLREGIQPATNWERYNDLKQIASTDTTRDQFLKTNLMVYRPEMADSEFKELVNLQASLRKGEDSEKLLGGYREASGIVNDTLKAIDIDPTPKEGTDEAKQVALFRRDVDRQIIQLQGKTGRKASNEEIQGIVDNLAIKGKVPGSGIFGTNVWADKKFAFELGDNESISVDIKDIPKREAAAIKETLKRSGAVVNDENVLKLYQMKLAGISNANK
jgi:hypothetical protein